MSQAVRPSAGSIHHNTYCVTQQDHTACLPRIYSQWKEYDWGIYDFKNV